MEINFNELRIPHRDAASGYECKEGEIGTCGDIAGLWSRSCGYGDSICWVPPIELLESEVKKNNALVKEAKAKISLYKVMEKYFDSITVTTNVKENVDDVPKPKTNKGADNSSRAADATRLANMLL